MGGSAKTTAPSPATLTIRERSRFEIDTNDFAPRVIDGFKITLRRAERITNVLDHVLAESRCQSGRTGGRIYVN